MKLRGVFPTIVFALALFAAVTVRAQSPPDVSTTFDAAKNRTTVRLTPAQIGGEKGKYHSLKFSVFYSHPGKTKRVPETLSLELLTVVKARQLDPDLYVVFVVNGEEIFLSSDRSAVLNPVPGKRWVGERLVFRLPYETFLKFAAAKTLAVKLDGVQFEFSKDHLHSLRDFARHVRQ